jgi:endonuclease/exonuclease/phosphatase family metal-dependent hydrolase
LTPMPLRVLTWNLLHGRAIPGARRDLLDEFATALAGWEWDVALLQEVPPWWPSPLAARSGASHRLVLTSRNGMLPVRRAIAIRWPDLIKSNGGGANAILVRGQEIMEHRSLRLARLPERRRLHAIRLADRTWVGNLHATAHNRSAAEREAELARAQAIVWARSAPFILGGDFNLRQLSLKGFEWAAGNDVDHVFVRGGEAVGTAEVLDRGPLSDHAPVAVTIG